jgi:beta-alanine degradation protein BauB
MSNSDVKQPGSTGSRVLLENDRVRVIERRIKAGVKTRLHSHPDMVVYSLRDSRTRYFFPDGTETVIELKAGDVVFKKAESHIAELITPEESLDFMVELK